MRFLLLLGFVLITNSTLNASDKTYFIFSITNYDLKTVNHCTDTGLKTHADFEAEYSDYEHIIGSKKEGNRMYRHINLATTDYSFMAKNLKECLKLKNAWINALKKSNCYGTGTPK